MSDVHTKEIRSYNMSMIRGKNTTPELIVRKFLHSKGFRFRLHKNELPGKPDIVLSKYKTVIFVHGCFWHGHNNCKYFVIPKTRTNWWIHKIDRNRQNDKQNYYILKQTGWKIITVWECELKTNNAANTLSRLAARIK